FGNTTKSGCVCKTEDFGTGETEDREGGVNGFHGVDDGLCLRGVLDDRVVETAVGLHVLDARTRRGSQRLQGADLVNDVVGQLHGINIQEATAESCKIPVADVGANHDAGLSRLLAGAANNAGVASVESARNVGTGNGFEHGCVVAQRPTSEG